MNAARGKKYEGTGDTGTRWKSYKIDRDAKVTRAHLLFMADMRGAPLPELKARYKWFPISVADPASGSGLSAIKCVPIHDVLRANILAPEYLLDLMILMGEVNLLAGHGGTGKSYLALILAVFVAIGRAFGGLKVARRRVLFFSCEDSGDVLRYRLLRILQHYGIGLDELDDYLVILDATGSDPGLYREDRSGAGTTQSYEDLQALCIKHSTEFLVIDNASDVFDANEISRPRVRAFLRSLRQLVEGMTVLILSHVDKATAKARGGAEGYSGSTAWNNSVRSRLLLYMDDAGRIKLEQQKNNYGKCGEPILLDWEDGVLVPLPPGSDERAQQADMGVVLGLIKEMFDRDEFIASANNSSDRAWHKLPGHPDFPKHLNNARLNALLRKAETEGKLIKGDYQGADRKPRKRWVVVAGASSP